MFSNINGRSLSYTQTRTTGMWRVGLCSFQISFPFLTRFSFPTFCSAQPFIRWHPRAELPCLVGSISTNPHRNISGGLDEISLSPVLNCFFAMEERTVLNNAPPSTQSPPSVPPTPSSFPRFHSCPRVRAPPPPFNNVGHPCARFPPATETRGPDILGL